MTPAQQFRLELLRASAFEVLSNLDTNEDEQCRLSAQLVLTIIAIDKAIASESDKARQSISS